jgi:hypothetical protein
VWRTAVAVCRRRREKPIPARPDPLAAHAPAAVRPVVERVTVKRTLAAWLSAKATLAP